MSFNFRMNTMSPPRDVVPVVFFVNGRRFHIVEDKNISYLEIVRLAQFPSLSEPTVTYKDGEAGGSMTIENSVPVHAGMVFNVAYTSNS